MSNDDRSLRGTGGGGSGGREPRRAVGIEERVDDRAIGDGVAAALRRHRLEHPFQPSQIGNFAADFAHMITRQLFDLPAGIGAAVEQAEQLADLLDRKAEIAAAPDKVEAPHETFSIEAVPARAAGRRRQQADALVVADRLDIAAGAGGEPPARQRLAFPSGLATPCGCWRELTRHCEKMPLEPVLATGTKVIAWLHSIGKSTPWTASTHRRASPPRRTGARSRRRRARRGGPRPAAFSA